MPAPPPGAITRDLRAEAVDQARVAHELAAADLELEDLDGLSPAAVAKTLLVLEAISGPIADPSTAAWLDVLRAKLRRAKAAGKGAVFVGPIEDLAGDDQPQYPLPSAAPPAPAGP